MTRTYLRTAITAIVLSAGLALFAGCAGGGAGGTNNSQSNLGQLNAAYTAQQVTAPTDVAGTIYQVGLGLNNAGQAVAGTVISQEPPPNIQLYPKPPTTITPYYLWQSANLTQLPAQYNFGQINNSGTVVTTTNNVGLATAGTYSAGTVTTFAIPAGYTRAWGQVINDTGDVAGYANNANAEAAFLWKDGNQTNLGLPADAGPTCTGINNSDEVVGQYTTPNGLKYFVWNNGTLTDLGTFSPAAINASGEIAGTITTPFSPAAIKASGETAAALPPSQPAVWNNGTLTALPLPSATRGYAVAINTSGEVVGEVYTNGTSFPALWNSGKVYNLSKAAESSSNKETIFAAYAINDSGQILAGASTSSGNSVVLLTPSS